LAAAARSGSGAVAAGAGRAGADDVINGVRLRAQLLGEEIAYGHGAPHALSVPGVSSLSQFASHIEQVVLNGAVRQLSNGRTAYWCNGTIVIRNWLSPDRSTAFRESFEYFMRQS
jgi:hypothetical protein